MDNKKRVRDEEMAEDQSMASDLKQTSVKDRKIVKTKRKEKDAKGFFSNEPLKRKDSSSEGELEFEDSDVEHLSAEDVVQRDEKDSDDSGSDWEDCDDDKKAKDVKMSEPIP